MAKERCAWCGRVPENKIVNLKGEIFCRKKCLINLAKDRGSETNERFKWLIDLDEED